MSHLLLWGNAYAQIIRNARGEVIALHPLMPNKMTVDRDVNGRLFYLYQRSFDDVPSLGKENQVFLNPTDVLHIPGSGFDGLVGYSPIAMAKNAVGLAIATEEYGAKFFANCAAPGGRLIIPECVADETATALLEYLRNRGYVGEAVETEDRLTISMPKELFTNANIETLQKIVTDSAGRLAVFRRTRSAFRHHPISMENKST